MSDHDRQPREPYPVPTELLSQYRIDHSPEAHQLFDAVFDVCAEPPNSTDMVLVQRLDGGLGETTLELSSLQPGGLPFNNDALVLIATTTSEGKPDYACLIMGTAEHPLTIKIHQIRPTDNSSERDIYRAETL